MTSNPNNRVLVQDIYRTSECLEIQAREAVDSMNGRYHAPHARVGGGVGRLEVGSIEAYEAADSAKIGSSVGCPQCGTDFVKRNQQHRFCCKEHRFAWHNERDPKRQEFIESRKSKAA